MKLVAVVGLVFALQASGTGHQPGAATQVDFLAVAQALWAPRAATVVVSPSRGEKVVNGRLIHGDGTGTLTYTLLERCDRAAAGLAEHFSASGWRQRRSQILMPRLRTSFTTGCERVPNGILSPEATTRGEQSPVALAWHGEWEDEQGQHLDLRRLVGQRSGASPRDGSARRRSRSKRPQEQARFVKGRAGCRLTALRRLGASSTVVVWPPGRAGPQRAR
jgi:hypothetical protein